MASIPTEVVWVEDDGHGPPCVIAAVTATPVGKPFQITRPDFWERISISSASESTSLACIVEVNWP